MLILHWRQLSGTVNQSNMVCPSEKLVWHKLDQSNSLSQIWSSSGDTKTENGQSWFCLTAMSMTLAMVPTTGISGTTLGTSFYHQSYELPQEPSNTLFLKPYLPWVCFCYLPIKNCKRSSSGSERPGLPVLLYDLSMYPSQNRYSINVG